MNFSNSHQEVNRLANAMVNLAYEFHVVVSFNKLKKRTVLVKSSPTGSEASLFSFVTKI